MDYDKEYPNTRSKSMHRMSTTGTGITEETEFMRNKPVDTIQQFDQFTEDTLEAIQINQEAPWDEAGESLLRKWMATSWKQAADHKKTGYKFKRLYKIYGILSVVSATFVFLMSNVSISSEITTDATVHSIIAFTNLLITNLATFLNYGPKYQLQFEFEGKFSKIAIDIEEILSIHKDFRSPKDRVLAEYKEKLGNLITHAPET